jgi:phosphonate transport system permease protein
MQKVFESTPAYRRTQRPPLINQKSLWGLLFLGALLWALFQAGLFQKQLVNPGGWTLVGRFIRALAQPELSPAFLGLALEATLTTLAYAVGGIFLSTVIGFAGGVLASEVWWQSVFPRERERAGMSTHQAPWLLVRGGLAVLRAIHEVIWGLFFVNTIGLDPLSAVLAIAIPYSAITAKVFSEIMDETPRQAYTALVNSGVTAPKAFVYTLLPQAFSDLLSYSFYRFECAIRSAAVLGIIGVGGLGYEIFLSLQTLKYEQIWTLLLALFMLNGMADLWSSTLRRRISQGSASAARDEVPGRGHRRRLTNLVSGDKFMRLSVLAAALMVPLAFLYINPEVAKLFSARTEQHFLEVSLSAIPPDFSLLGLGGWLERAGTTLAMSLLAVAGAGVAGLILAFPATNNLLTPGGVLDRGSQKKPRRVLSIGSYLLSRGVLLIARSIPAPLWALILLFVLFPGILPGAIALGLYTLGVLGRLLAEVIENLDQRPMLALKAQGATAGQIFIYGVFPLTFPRYVSYLLYRWEEAIRVTIVIGLVGAGGLGRLLIEQLSSFDYASVLATLIIFIAITFLVDLTSAAVRRSFREAA